MAPGGCTVCTHAQRTDIDAALVRGESGRSVGARFGLSKDAVRRHKSAHLSPALRAVITKRPEAGPRKALDRLEDLYERASRILEAAESEGSASVGLGAIRELRGITETLAKITGELDERPQVNVLNVSTSPEWAALRGVILGALAAHPDAARDVAAALAQVETPAVIEA